MGSCRVLNETRLTHVLVILPQGLLGGFGTDGRDAVRAFPTCLIAALACTPCDCSGFPGNSDGSGRTGYWAFRHGHTHFKPNHGESYVLENIVCEQLPDS